MEPNLFNKTIERPLSKELKYSEIVKIKTCQEPQQEIKIKEIQSPTNLWKYNGIRVENIIQNDLLLRNKFSEFGKILKIVYKLSNTSVLIYYDNPISPLKAITKYQDKIDNCLSINKNGNKKELQFFFQPTDDQIKLGKYRAKYPKDDNGECYYWRTTSCTNYKCKKYHFKVNKQIDLQLWMQK